MSKCLILAIIVPGAQRSVRAEEGRLPGGGVIPRDTVMGAIISVWGAIWLQGGTKGHRLKETNYR